MQNYKIILQYEGTRYQGWQKQDSTDNTIQGKLEAILSKLAKSTIEVHGSGRTDSGVHALAQVANFHINVMMSAQEIMNYVNQYLPEDIAVIKIEEVDDRFHSRLLAKGKTYCYRVLNSDIPDVFKRRYVYVVHEKLDVEAMKQAASYLLGTHDFKAFCTKKKMKKSTVRTITHMDIQTVGEEIRFTYTGNGFLYHMVRIMTGTLLEVGLHEKTPEQIPDILLSKIRENAGALVPGGGLTLVNVRYE